MSLLIASVLILIGLTKGITARLYLNDYVAGFMIFVIVLLNLRGGIALSPEFSLSVGGILSLPICTYTLIKRSERTSDVLFAILSMIGASGIAFVYSLHFLDTVELDPRLLATLLSLLVGLWCAFAARRTFAACLFSAVVGSFLGITIYILFFRKSGNIGGNYTFAVMWLSALFGLMIQYLLTVMMRQTKSPRANSYFEAGELVEKEEDTEGKKD